MKIDKERCRLLEDVLNNDSSYSFDAFCRENGLYSELDRKRVDGVFIICPFHSDKNPSLLITESARRWKCFACGAGSRYTDFVTRYRRDVLGLNESKAQVMNTILANDGKLQVKLGFHSIYRTLSNSDMSEVRKIGFKRFKINQSQKMGYLELASWMIKNKCSKKEKLYAVALMQSGLSPDVIQHERVSAKTYSMEELEDEHIDRDNL